MHKTEPTDIAILGAAGLTGKELLTLLVGHPYMNPVHITSNQHTGQRIGSVFPQLDGRFDLEFKSHEEPLPYGIPVFLAVPNQTSLELVPELLKKGHRIVDLSGSYRLHNKEIFSRYYKLDHTSFELMEQQVFGIPEIFRDKIRSTNLLSNPGCYSTGSILPLYLLDEYRNDVESVVISAASGVSGAGGRVEDAGFSFNGVHENFRAYKILKHQHLPEIEEYSATGMENGFGFPFIFTPHLLPLYRGILSTIVVKWKSGAPESLLDHFRRKTESEPFLRVRNTPEEIQLSSVQETNFLDLSCISEGDHTVIVSALDNLQKGAAGQAIQNLNLMLGYSETDGLL